MTRKWSEIRAEKGAPPPESPTWSELAADAVARELAAYRARLRERVEAEFPGEVCGVPTDPEDYICLVHSEILFDDRCEDYPAAKVRFLALIDEGGSDD